MVDRIYSGNTTSPESFIRFFLQLHIQEELSLSMYHTTARTLYDTENEVVS